MVEHLARRARAAGWANVEAVLVPVDDPRLEPGSCDRILIVDTWHHIDHRARYAQKLRAALKPGGFVLIVDFTLDSEFGPPAKYRIPPAETQRELSAGRLDASVLDEDLPNQYAVRGVRR
jgi:SAM-dependent methyltransferase